MSIQSLLETVKGVESPWLTPTDSPKPSTPQPKVLHESPGSSHISEYGVTKLEAEPQEGPTEYKLHLLLRPRRTYSSSSTGSIISGSQQHKQQPVNQERASPVLAPSNQSKQKRLEQLTTQLLWRLQQSSPYHASSTSDLVSPKLPGSATSLDAASRPGKLLAGLEESRGALYEIGVSDDGTFVGLTSDELDESLVNLRAMAASLGCNVEVTRKVVVGESTPKNLRHREKLWVAEAFVSPDLSLKRSRPIKYDEASVNLHDTPQSTINEVIEPPALQKEDTTEQLRITLTGPTTSVRGLVGWAPHWTVLCIAANDTGLNGVGSTSSTTENLATAGAGTDLAKAHLELCLKLDKPLAVVISKLDLASKPGTLMKFENKVINPIAMADLKSVVPIILTSAVTGVGIRQLHALLQALPIPTAPTPHDYIGMALNPEQPLCLFHIEDVFGVPASYDSLTFKSNGNAGSVVAGHLRFGRLSIGDSIVIGPFPADSDNDCSLQSFPRFSPISLGTSHTYSSAATELSKIASRNTPAASVTKSEWYNAHINRRNTPSNSSSEWASQPAPQIRKGMVMAMPSKHMLETHHSLQAASGFTASFDDVDINSITPGTIVVVYIASIRASARVLKLAPSLSSKDINVDLEAEEAEDVFWIGSIGS
ncbi:hypothetical protein EYC84_011289 [Monilinia fructicola]|uniref:Tr-type G domain-containing protein n=1 Tax=Monilinia fructicola TaxID=38448 RepID=A0A5M9JAK0_MONFR|nr:hypothetical protein EYC84_011289 [Monilinia fructicola]